MYAVVDVKPPSPNPKPNASRRRTSLENIKKARAMHNRRVNQRRRESFDDARAERNRDNLRRERRRRAMERYEEGKARVLEQSGFVSTSGGASMSRLLRGGAGSAVGGIPNTKCTNVEAGRDNRRRRAAEARQAAKARQTQRMRSLRQRMLSNGGSRVSECKTRLFAARLLQEWWRCVRAGKSFDVADLGISSPEGTPLQRSPLGSPTAWAAAQGLGLSVPDVGFGSVTPLGANGGSGGGGDKARKQQQQQPALDPCTRSPITTSGRFSPGVDGRKRAVGVGVGVGAGDAAGGGRGSGGGVAGGSSSGGEGVEC